MIDVSSCSVVSVWCMKRSLRKFAAYVFNVSALIFIYLSLGNIYNLSVVFTAVWIVQCSFCHAPEHSRWHGLSW